MITRFEQEQINMHIDRHPVMRKLSLARIVLITLCITGLVSTLSDLLTDSEQPLTGLAFAAILGVFLFLVEIIRNRLKRDLYRSGINRLIGKGSIQ
jgi:hypothetical protein